jgi:SAM-dependent methyltransferase
MEKTKLRDLEESYDRLAKPYAERIFKELENKPLDRQLLDRFAASVKNLGPVCDLGCGPGHIAGYLRDRGLEVCGIDLSPAMLEQAKALNPDLEFQQGNMLSLDIADETFAGLAAFYSIIHIPREEVIQALTELQRVLRRGGLLLLSFHIGDETTHVEELWGEKVAMDFSFFQPGEMRDYLTAAGFEIEEIIERPPYNEKVEYQSHRAYIFARKPA